MRVRVLRTTGYEEALFGVGLSFGITSGYNFFPFVENTEIQKKLKKVSRKLCNLEGGEDKFLRQIKVSLDTEFPLYWWKQADTYKVGTTAQSESTMHTLMKNEITQSCFEHPIFPETLKHLEGLRKQKEFEQLVNELPSGWLQRRIWTMNYAVLKNIFKQRYHHKLPEWQYFCEEVRSNVPYNFLLPKLRMGLTQTT